MPNQRNTASYFTGAFVITAITWALGFAYGYFTGGGLVGGGHAGLTAGLSALGLTAILSVLEVTLSFDNAVVNAGILKEWPPAWRQAFLVFGILFAVVGMRLLLPIVLVTLTTGRSIPDVFNLAFRHPADYATVLTASKYLVEAFGGAFLMMIATEFFFDHEKDNHWIGIFEQRFTVLGQIEAIQVLFTLACILIASRYATSSEQLGFICAGVLGVMGFVATKGLGTVLGGDAAEAGEKIVKATIFGFLYLEVLDASFSFDGVMGAFAVTTSLPIIMLGLGTGAYWVRSLTIWVVDYEKLAEYRYLENGAYWAIGILAAIMFASVKFDVPDIVTGLIGAVLIGAAFFSSLAANKREAREAYVATKVEQLLQQQSSS